LAGVGLLALVSVFLLVPIFVLTQAVGAEDAPETTETIREIFVPYEDLNVLLEGGARRVFLTRDEYDDLLARAERAPAEEPAPQGALLLDAKYEATILDERVRLLGVVDLEVLEEGLYALPLPMTGVGVRSATIADQSAAIGIGADGVPVLFVQGVGRHRLTLEMVAPLQTSAAQQSLSFRLPTPAATQLRLTVPGNVEVKSGAQVIDRDVDETAGVTRFELVLPRGQLSLVMSLNNRMLRQQQVVVSRSVDVDEVTTAYERLHTTVSLDVLHGAADRFRFALPDGFEPSEVLSPLLARWAVREVDGQRVLEVILREAATETVVLNVSATRNSARLEDWSMPRLVPLDVAGHVAVVGLVVEDRLSAERIEYENLVPIDNEFLTAALPETVFRADPGAPRVRLVAAYYAPQQEYRLQAGFQKPPARLQATTNVLLVLDDLGQHVRGGFALLPSVDKLFAVRFTSPRDWYVTGVTTLDGTPLPVERYERPEGDSLIHVRLPHGVSPGEVTSISFRAERVPTDWLGEWETQKLAFPIFAVQDTTRDTGAIAIRGDDDLLIRPDQLSGLSPLDENEMQKYGLGDVQSNLAYRYEAQPYEATLNVSRTEPTLTARCFSFLKIAPEGLSAHYEIVYDIRQARARQLSLILPKDTPASLAIEGLDGLTVKESRSEDVEQGRRWTALLADSAIGVVRLAVDFQQPLPDEQLEDYMLPLARAVGVTHQSAVVAVEGHAELDIDVKTDARSVDVGELVAAQYRVGRRLLGVYEFVSTEKSVRVDVLRRPGYGLPAAIVQRAELVTLLSASGISQTAARYQLRTKAALMEVQLPAESSLWSVYLDGKPVAPQRDGDRLLLNLPASSQQSVRDLQVIYLSPVSSLGLIDELRTEAPVLLLRTDRDATPREVPTADVTWQLVLPEGHRLVRSDGTVFTDALPQRPSPIWTAAAALYWLGGGVHSPMQAAREARRQAGSARFLSLSSRMEATTSEPMSQSGPSVVAGLGEEVSGMQSMGGVEMDDLAVEIETLQIERRRGQPMAGDGLERQRDEPRGERGLVPGAGTPLGTPQTPGLATMLDVPPTDQPASRRPQRGEQIRGLAVGGKRWALEGVRSLRIEMQQTGDELTFQSLGVQPRLDVTISDDRKITLWACGVALAVLALGVLLTRRSAKAKTRYVVSVALLALVLPLATGLAHQLGDTFDYAFYAACLLTLYYLAVGALRWCVCSCCRSCATQAAVLLLVGGTWCLPPASAQQPAEPTIDREALIDLLTPYEPIALPEDAVIIPYDAENVADGIRGAEKVLVPYDKYAELWNRAFPDQKLETKPPVVPYSLAGAAYTATLSDDETLLLVGHIDIDLYAETPVQVPLHLTGGVLASATIDGQPARLRIIAVDPAGDVSQQKQQVTQQLAVPGPQANAPAQMQQQERVPDRAFALLQLQGKGRKRLDLRIRMNLRRRGGWRLTSGRLPTAPATALTLTVPAAQTEIRLTGVADRVEYETTADDQRIETALDAQAMLGIQWRPKVAEGQVDHSLTARSEAVLDVQEDGLRLVWQLDLQFPRSRRDAFTVLVPADYLVEKVLGDNVRAWEVEPDQRGQRLRLTLLKETADQERVTLLLSRRGMVAAREPTQFAAPVIAVDGAMLHKGRLTIRRSPLVELRTTGVSGPTRTDIPTAALAQLNEIDTTEASPLGLRPYQAFEFGATPFSLQLSATPVVTSARATVQTLLRIAERETTLETRVVVNVRNRPYHRFRMLVPGDLEIDDISVPGQFTWSITDDAQGSQLLNVYLAAGQSQTFSVVIRGSLGRRQADDLVAAPKLDVLDMTRQQGDIVVQIDPAFNVRAVNLTGCETILLSRVFPWLQTGQRRLARLALRYTSAEYDAQFRINQRSARVHAHTISNVKVTDVALEETIILDLTVQDAGIREVVFQLPSWLAGARISARNLRQKTVEDTANGWKRFRLELQDEVLGQYRVLVENDRALLTANADESETYEVPIPVLETGRTDQRFVTLENVGRDEVVVVDQIELSLLGRQQAEWRKLAASLGDGITTAYVVENEAQMPKLTFQTKQRKTVRTAGASIGLGETLLVVDANGAYRGQQTYHVNNTTEQYLEVHLPAGAQLWTATVSGEPVKPTEVPDASTPNRVRIPLTKTAEGDRDYPVVLKYGGRVGSGQLRTSDDLSFPLIRTVNINVELSQVRLRLPDTHRWFDFDGSMRQVFDESEYMADFFLYNRQQVKRLMQVWDSENPYAKARVANNLKQIELAMHNNQDTYRTFLPNATFKKNYDANTSVIQQAQQQTKDFFAQEGQIAVDDNRRRLNTFWMEQKNGLARNIVNDLPGNFGSAAVPQPAAKPQSGKENLNYDWLSSNQLDNREKYSQKELESRFGRVREEAGQEGKKLKQDRANLLGKQSLLGDIAGEKAAAKDKSRKLAEQRQSTENLSKSQRLLARQYQQQLEQESLSQMRLVPQGDESLERLAAGEDSKDLGVGQGIGGGTVTAARDGEIALPQTPADAYAVEIHLASLDVDFPERGVEFMFRTTRGDIEITARAVSQPLLERVIRLAWIAAAMLAIVIIWKLFKRIGPYLARSMWAASLLIPIALFSAMLGLFPLLSLLALLVGIVQLVRLIWMRRSQRRAATAS
jgi:hypothetical protein